MKFFLLFLKAFKVLKVLNIKKYEGLIKARTFTHHILTQM